MFSFSKKISVPALIIISAMLFIGWGQVGHKLINKKTTDGLPASMNYFKTWSTYLSNHASDADNRKGSDPTEEFRHYIDIDDYPEFLSNGTISQSLDTMIQRYGANRVNDNGILPWAILKTTDSLTGLFRQKDWARAQLTAADLGHYVGDGHMPLHITKNYNGQLSNQTGVHSRYESTMIGAYQSQLVYTVDSAKYITNKTDFIFSFIYANHKFVDSVLQADRAAATFAGGTSGSTYSGELWRLTKGFTIPLFQKASSILSSLIYTAWKDAGSPDPTSFVDMLQNMNGDKNFSLQAYPNPFNAQITISFKLPDHSITSDGLRLTVYSVTGAAMFGKSLYGAAGTEVKESLEMNNCPAGIYFVALQAGPHLAVKKIVLLK